MASIDEHNEIILPDSPTSRFTAVNSSSKEGASSSGPVVNSSGNANSNNTLAREQIESSMIQPRSPPLNHEKQLTTQNSLNNNEGWTVPTAGERNIFQPQPSHLEPEGSHKRKRSSSTSHSPYQSMPPKHLTTTGFGDSETAREEAMRQHLQPDSRETFISGTPYRPYMTAIEEREPPHDSEAWAMPHYSQQLDLTSDEQIGEVLQRASQNLDAHGHNGHSTPTVEEKRNLQTFSQADPKKRKRNFSNRTKTGCLTCRRRKKKCDESKPECNNCIRGGFVCSGYQQRGQWPKTETKQAPVLLQSKTEYENSPYSTAGSYILPSMSGSQRREPLPGQRGQSLRIDPQHDRPSDLDDDHSNGSSILSGAVNSVASPDTNRLPAISYAQQSPTPVTATSTNFPDRHPKNIYEHTIPLHDVMRQESRLDADANTSHLVSPNLPQLLHPQMHVDNSHTTNPQVAAQLALSNLAATNRPRSQKEEMLAGRHYFPFDKQLVLERESCSGACWRFNTSTNPNNGVSSEERARLFRDILQPQENLGSPQASFINPVGRVGDNVVVEAPFTCDYGYNISIGQDVAIGKNCTILDTCEVQIGDRCHIGPNVNIYTAMLPIDPKKRLGSKGPHLGRKVIIESDCWIGGGVIILPGRTIGKGATVGAGSVVSRDIPPYTVARGNPAHVLRGIGHDE